MIPTLVNTTIKSFGMKKGIVTDHSYVFKVLYELPNYMCWNPTLAARNVSFSLLFHYKLIQKLDS